MFAHKTSAVSPNSTATAVADTVAESIRAAGLEQLDAPFNPHADFVNSAMRERVLVADTLIADLTDAGPAVAFDVGVRLATPIGKTLLLASSPAANLLPTAVLRSSIILIEPPSTNKAFDSGSLAAELSLFLQQSNQTAATVTTPLVKANDPQGGGIAHRKVDQYIESMRSQGPVAAQVKNILDQQTPHTEKLQNLRQLQHILCTPVNADSFLPSNVFSLFFAYREVLAYDDMVCLFNQIPPDLKQLPVLAEQLALALNRQADALDSSKRYDEAKLKREQGISALFSIVIHSWTSETYSILGRIYKSIFDSAELRGAKEEATAALDRAIDAYSAGFSIDPRDSYPGINAVTLRLARGTKQDLDIVTELASIVSFAVKREPRSDDEMERYWQTATLMELASARGRWVSARSYLDEMLRLEPKAWMLQTTTKNLRIQLRTAHQMNREIEQLEDLITKLEAEQ